MAEQKPDRNHTSSQDDEESTRFLLGWDTTGIFIFIADKGTSSSEDDPSSQGWGRMLDGSMTT